MARNFTGIVVAEVIEARFAFSGKVARVNKSSGDEAAAGTIIASLDRRAVQAELDRQLADYEKVRAKFEISKIETANTTDVNKFLLQASQSELNAAVKEVELAKYRLDNVDLISPVSGIILDLNGLKTGIYATPGANAVSVLDTASYRFKFSIDQKGLPDFPGGTEVQIEIFGTKEVFTTKTARPIFGVNGKFDIFAPLPANLLPGMQGKLWKK